MKRRLWIKRLIIVAAMAILVIPALAAAAPAPARQYFWSEFPKVDYSQTHPLVPGQFDNQHYPKYAEVQSLLERWAKIYPNIVSVYSGGTSYEGRTIWQMTISSKQTATPPDSKPAMYIGGNRHSGEVTARVATLTFANWLLTNYGKDPEVTKLVDTRTFYIRPTENPDGGELYLTTANTLRSTVRPYDQDGDGLTDEDPCEDLNNDGYCTNIREYVGPGKGNYAKDPIDPSGRLMKNVGDGKGDYLYTAEGIDNDKDGRINEDGIGGLDLHRNYPENWRPMKEYSGYGWTQSNAGEYPLSEPEMRSLVLFLLSHPNTTIGQTMDTSYPMHLRPPSTSHSEESMKPKDLEYYRYFDTEGKKLSGYTSAGDVFHDYSRGDDEPLFGHSPDFGYFQFGSIWYGDELWGTGEVVQDFNKDGAVNNLDRLWMNDNIPEYKGIWLNWQPVTLPNGHRAEVGGWNPKFWSQNPPAGKTLQVWAEKETAFNKLLAKSLPLITQVGPVTLEKRANDQTVIRWTLTNEGLLPDALDQAWLVKIVRPDLAEITLPADGSVTLVDPAMKSQSLPFFAGKLEKDKASTQTVEWVVQGSGTVTLKFFSTRGGRVTATVVIPTAK